VPARSPVAPGVDAVGEILADDARCRPFPDRAWVVGRRLAPVALLGLAVYLLLPHAAQSGATWTTLRGASWPWITAAVGATTLTYLAAAGTWIAAAPVSLGLGRTFTVQLAAAAANRITPAGIGGMTTNVRYLQRAGATRVEAVTTAAVNSGAGLVAHVVSIVAIAPLLGASGGLALSQPDLADHWMVLLAVGAGLSALGLIKWGRALHRRLRPTAIEVFRTIRRLAAQPARAACVLAAALALTGAYSLALFACTRAFGAGVSPLKIVAVYLAASAVAAVAPTPGGLGALDAALVAGLGAAGLRAPQAVAAVLTYRTLTYWLPVLPGLAAQRGLRRRAVI
jgi:glycosyltransferase 2 family protein